MLNIFNTLTVNFDLGTISGETTDESGVSAGFAGSSFKFSLEGNFDVLTRLVSGTTTFLDDDDSDNIKTSAGKLSGLIGTEGIVAVFVSNPGETDFQYAGGLLAKPNRERRFPCTSNPFQAKCHR